MKCQEDRCRGHVSAGVFINQPGMIFADETDRCPEQVCFQDEVMMELNKINREGTTIMLVTHDVKVAAKCSRVMYIVDGNIKGEYNLDKMEVKVY